MYKSESMQHKWKTMYPKFHISYQNMIAGAKDIFYEVPTIIF